MKLAIFDLDYTIWKPEMYQLRGPPSLISIDEYNKKHGNKRNLSKSILRDAQTKHDGQILIDRDGSIIQMFEGARYALEDIQRLRDEGMPINAAIASRTDRPDWAHICMNHLTLSDGTTLQEVFQSADYIEISYGAKYNHISRLQRKTVIPYNEMCFFDNEYGNIQDVQSKLPAVKSYYTPDGMTKDAWDSALKHFNIK